LTNTTRNQSAGDHPPTEWPGSFCIHLTAGYFIEITEKSGNNSSNLPDVRLQLQDFDTINFGVAGQRSGRMFADQREITLDEAQLLAFEFKKRDHLLELLEVGGAPWSGDETGGKGVK
jgi:hypothetical protein